jgi:drug/metabolite transporter (DMT)-like permease
MKIRYYKKIDGWRWVGFLLAMLGAFTLSNANVETQWLGWSFGLASGLIWIYMGYKDGDLPRTLMEVMWFAIGIRAVWNWLQ